LRFIVHFMVQYPRPFVPLCAAGEQPLRWIWTVPALRATELCCDAMQSATNSKTNGGVGREGHSWMQKLMIPSGSVTMPDSLNRYCAVYYSISEVCPYLTYMTLCE